MTEECDVPLAVAGPDSSPGNTLPVNAAEFLGPLTEFTQALEQLAGCPPQRRALGLQRAVSHLLMRGALFNHNDGKIPPPAADCLFRT